VSLTQELARILTDYNNPGSLGSRLRARRLVPLLELVRDTYARYGCVEIVDVGGTETYWRIVPSDFLDAHNVAITLVNLPGSNKTVGHGRFTIVEADGCDLGCFKENAFHIAHSNSVIEHVGDRERMAAFAKEIARVAPVCYVQTPYFWFPIEPHTLTPLLHWLPKIARVALVSHFALGHWPRANTKEEALRLVDSARLLDRKAFRTLFPEADIRVERFLRLPKSLIAVKGL
jgi:hypothetical protein